MIGVERIGDAPVREFGAAERPFDGVRVLSFTHAVAGPTVGRTLAEQGADVLGATRPNDYEHEFIYAEANVGSRSAYIDLDKPAGRERAERLLAEADVVVDNYRLGSLGRRGLDPHDVADRHPGVVFVSVTCYGSSGPWAGRGGFDMNGSAASGLMTVEGSESEPRLPVTALINDYITGYMGAIGASAALVKRAPEGGSWHVTVSLTRSAMWCGSLGFVDPELAGSTASTACVSRSPTTLRPLSGLSTCSPRPFAFRTRRPRGPTRFSSHGARARPNGVPEQGRTPSPGRGCRDADSIGETPRAGSRDLPRRDARHESIGPIVSRRRELTVSDASEHGYGPADLDAGDPFDHHVGTESFEGDVGLDRQRHPRVAPDVP